MIILGGLFIAIAVLTIIAVVIYFVWKGREKYENYITSDELDKGTKRAYEKAGLVYHPPPRSDEMKHVDDFIYKNREYNMRL